MEAKIAVPRNRSNAGPGAESESARRALSLSLPSRAREELRETVLPPEEAAGRRVREGEGAPAPRRDMMPPVPAQRMVLTRTHHGSRNGPAIDRALHESALEGRCRPEVDDQLEALPNLGECSRADGPRVA